MSIIGQDFQIRILDTHRCSLKMKSCLKVFVPDTAMLNDFYHNFLLRAIEADEELHDCIPALHLSMFNEF